MSTWREEYEGDAEAERVLFEHLAQDMMHVQLKSRKRSKAAGIQRAFHSKAVFAAVDGMLTFVSDLPGDLGAGFAQPGKSYPVIVRFSNASGSGQPDSKPDLRGVALRIKVSDSEQHDLLATNFPVSHARNAKQFVAFARATAGGTLSRLAGLVGLAFACGPSETIRMLRNIAAGRRREVSSLALETFWSRGAIRWGDTLAVRYLLRPAPGAAAAPERSETDPDFLSNEFARRLDAGPVRFELCIQRYVDATSTPIEDTAIEWTEMASPPVKVADLAISKPASGIAEAFTNARVIDELAFNPWNTTDEFRPLGNLNRARKVAYDASAAHRLAYRFRSEVPFRNRVFGAAARSAFAVVNRRIEWHKLPLRLSLLNLDAFRHVLRLRNLIDTDIGEAPPKARPEPQPPIGEDVRLARSYDGTFNDLSSPKMGSVGSTFGRNLKPSYRPRVVRHAERGNRRAKTPASRHVPSGTLAQHPGGRVDPVPGARLGEPCAPSAGQGRHRRAVAQRHEMDEQGRRQRRDVMRIAGNEVRGDDGGKRPPIFFGNAASHWWDGSEVYGPNSEKAMKLRRWRQDQAREQSPAGRRRGLRAHRLQRKLVARPQCLAHAVCPRAQSVVRRTQGALRQLGR